MFAVFALPEVQTDLSVDFGDFAATTVTFSAVTEAGRKFLGAVSVTVLKSAAPEFSAHAAKCGIFAK